ncbi:PLAC8 motif-containing protein [Parasponia andersonii]|uniref:PLAC8 motif-containing protein n=1 Tax=Parasponia andersonii TaxID=3476 RepID=A0A2P5BXT2_PARAD|nr:PLAC8 motif-containing protein [Parasponia andersonii]
MNPTKSEGSLTEVPDVITSTEFQEGCGVYDSNAHRISTMEAGLLNDENPRRESMLPHIPGRLKLPKFNRSGSLVSPSAKLREIADERDEISRSVSSLTSAGLGESFTRIAPQKVDWAAMNNSCKNWIKNPLNMALLLWISCVAISGAILFLVMTGMLNHVLTKKSERDAWFEVNNQILNALFTLMCLYQHPKRFHHLVLLCRWKPKDVSMLRKIYCKNGTYKPHEWAHMMVVIVLLHVNCFAQYALCGLNLGFKRSERPAAGIGICLCVAIAAPATAGVYSIMSPLGKEYNFEVDDEAQDQKLTNGIALSKNSSLISSGRTFSFASRVEQRIVEHAPEWKGGLFDSSNDVSMTGLSLFCGFCVFGWNMERLGFGNMYVHIVTFFLFCTAPFWIFNLAAINIDNEGIREALGLTGIVLCVFGLLYGGFWRIQMRKRFNLPANHLCCGKPAVTDCAQWLCCCWCSLAQEVRTADFYDTVEDKFCMKQVDNKHSRPAASVSPLPHEDRAIQFSVSSPSILLGNSPELSILVKEDSQSSVQCSKDCPSHCCCLNQQLPKVEDIVIDNIMKPPVPSAIQRDDSTIRKEK